ncbi:hypothetical protein TWF718_010440 [Orbilia javanica]|uniref:GPI inositol-deacylase winged helix domain-containing protein n=1 Tax=Orbilia javanica TaxID=47235 RepID=A0AAN8MQV4_9PEZI
MRVALEILPTGEKAYDQAYEDAMVRIEGQNKDFKDLAHQVLSWITRARRPVTTLELQHALAVETGLGQLELDQDNCPEKTKMVSVCAGLVMIDEESQIIRLVHYTTQEYFDRTWQKWFRNAEKNIAEACVTYLSYGIFKGPSITKEDLEARLRLNALYNYAANYWGYHTNISSIGSALLVITFLGNRDAVLACSQVLEPFRYDYHAESFGGWTAVHLAAYAGAYGSIEDMLDKDADLEAKDNKWRRTPLSWAAKKGHESIVKLLVDRRADLEAKDRRGQTPLSLAVEHGHEAVVRLLVDRGADLEAQDSKWDRTPLSWAAGHGHEAIVRLLVDRGVDLEAQDSKWGRTPLFFALVRGHEAVVKLLMDRGANLEAESTGLGQTPLSWAVENGHEAVVKLLVDGGANLEAESTGFGQTPLSWAAEHGREAVVKLLVDGGANLEAKDRQGRVPLFWAAKNEHEAVVRLLVDRITDLEAKKEQGRIPLLWAANGKYDLAVKLRLGRDAISGRTEGKQRVSFNQSWK